MKELKLNEIYLLEGRFYRLTWTKWDNGKKQGNRAILVLLTDKELNKLLIEQIEKGELNA